MTPNTTKKPSESFARRRGLAPLTGTPSQIEFAGEVRTRMLTSLESAIRTSSYLGGSKQLVETKNWLSEKTEATFWINNRHLKPSQLMRLRYAQACDIYSALLRA